MIQKLKNLIKAVGGVSLQKIIGRRKAFKLLGQYHEQANSIEDRVKWAMNFGGVGLFRVSAIQQVSEITALTQAVADLKPKKILEIGTANGGTLLLWSSLATEQVISCDILEKRIQSTFYKAFPPPGSKCKIDLLQGDSHQSESKQQIQKKLAGDKVDFLFLDGDHTQVGITADYEDYKEFVRPGGIIAFHDILESQPHPTNQVYYLWKDLKENLDTEEFIEDPEQCGYGIGIIRVPA